MPLGLALKQSVPQGGVVIPGHLWVMASNAHVIMVMNPATLAIETTITLPPPFLNAGTGICFDGTFIWVAGSQGGATGGALFKYTTAGVYTGVQVGPGLWGSNPYLVYNSSNGLIYGIGADLSGNFGVFSLDPVALTFTVVENIGPTLGAGDIDTASSLIGCNVVSPDTEYAFVTYPGPDVISTVSLTPAGLLAPQLTAFAGGFFYTPGWNTGAPVQGNIFIGQINPVGPVVTRLTPPAPTPPGKNAGGSVVWVACPKYNATKNLVYVGYPAADTTYTHGRVDSIVPSTGVMATVNNSQLPAPGTLTDFVFIETEGNFLWFADGLQHVSLIELTGGTLVLTATVPAGQQPQQMVYTPT